jgi:hypothetical protein
MVAVNSKQIPPALKAKPSCDPAIASTFLAEYLPKIVENLRPRERWIPLRTINRDWRLCCRRSCKALVANLRPTAQRTDNVGAG